MRSMLNNPAQAHELVPPFTWKELEERLTLMASTPVKRSMVPTLVSAVRKQSWALPAAGVLAEILALAWVLNDHTFQPELPSEEGPDQTL